MTLSLNLSQMIHKDRSVGCSTFMEPEPVTLDDLLLDGGCLLYVGKELGRSWNLPELMLEVAFVDEAEIFGAQLEETLNVLVFGERLPDVVHLRAVVLSMLVREKKNPRDREPAWRKVDVGAVGPAPNRMKFGLDVHPGAFPNGPADQPRAAMLGDVALDDGEALVLRNALKRGTRHVERRAARAPAHLPGKGHDVGLDELGRTHGLSRDPACRVRVDGVKA